MRVIFEWPPSPHGYHIPRGSAFRAAGSGRGLFGALTARNTATANLFFDIVRYGPDALLSLPGRQQSLIRHEIATAFSLVFAFVGGISCLSATMSTTLPVRRF